MADTVTQILYPTIDPKLGLGDETSTAGKAWSKILDIIEASPGFIRVYWGRRVEEPEKVQMHIVRPSRKDHDAFIKSPAWTSEARPLLEQLTGSPAAEMTIRHAALREYPQPQPCLALGRGPATMPVGTAVYLGTDDAWDEGAWPLWTKIVRDVDGCRGVSGGRIDEPVGGLERGYLVYVAWASVAHHDGYHHTKHFARHSIILSKGNKGYAEYGHVMFQGGREAKKAAEPAARL